MSPTTDNPDSTSLNDRLKADIAPADDPTMPEESIREEEVDYDEYIVEWATKVKERWTARFS